MTNALYGSSSRTPLIYRGRRIRGVWERQRADGTLVYEIQMKRGGNGYRRTLTATTPSQAIREAERVLTAFSEGEIATRRDVRLTTLSDDFLAWASVNLSLRTHELYEQRLRAHVLRLLGESRRADAVTTAEIRRLIERLSAEGLSGSTVRVTVTAMSAMFRHAVRRGVVERNPCRDLERGDRPSAKRLTEPRYLDAEQIAFLLDGLRPEFRPIAATCAYAALRISEALALRWEHVDLVGRVLHVPGTKTEASGASVPMIPILVDELRAHRDRQAQLGFERVKSEALVFQTRSGKPQSKRNALRAVHVSGDAANLNGTGRRSGSTTSVTPAPGSSSTSARRSQSAAILRHSTPRVTLTMYAGLLESEREALRNDLAAAFGAQ